MSPIIREFAMADYQAVAALWEAAGIRIGFGPRAHAAFSPGFTIHNTPSRALFARQGYEHWSTVVTVSKGL